MIQNDEPTIKENLDLAAEAIKRGDIESGKVRLALVLQREPNNVLAWLWMSRCFQDRENKIRCLRKILEIDPNNKHALEGIRAISLLEQTVNHKDTDRSSDVTDGGLQMAKFVTLSCPTCGGKLEITEDVDRFACGHCGNEHIVKRISGIVSIEPVVEELRKIGSGTDRTASELAIKRLTDEIKELRSKISYAKMGEDCGYAREFSLLLIIGGGIAIICGIFSIVAGEGYGAFMGLVFGFIAIAAGWSTLEKISNEIKEINSTVAWCEKQIRKKQKELHPHRKIVEH